MSDVKFKLTFTPTGAEPRTWEVDLVDGVKISELIAMQKVSGIEGYGPLVDGIGRTDPLAIKAVLWLMLKREMSTVPWDTLDFTLGEVQIEDVDMEPGELRAKLESMQRNGALNDLGRQKLQELLDAGVELPGDDEDSSPKG